MKKNEALAAKKDRAALEKLIGTAEHLLHVMNVTLIALPAEKSAERLCRYRVICNGFHQLLDAVRPLWKQVDEEEEAAKQPEGIQKQ